MSLLDLNYFEIFDIKVGISIDIENLNKQYLSLQTKFHPDRFVNASNLEKTMATRISTYINDAYETLGDLVKRVDYIIRINNYSVDENVTFRNNDFLTEQMLLSDQIAKTNPDEYDKIKKEISIKIKKIILDMTNNLKNHDFETLYQNNSMIKFYKKNINVLSDL